ncbi:SNF2 domain-containing protein CLASSY 1-like isoform X2 [Senna tora]|uniref:SNF2 domain-containing protein CLASSY 1-like isoform X2 n=1 Tax=Senna tora TaxID=362788 RepID=A0A834T735_9FABA|nr:SNF2 domain-containing protein CLASSY 1-like isoform X2 [Senna tora]
MTQRKRRLDQLKHPIDSYPFETIYNGSWHALEFITIKGGMLALNFKDNNYVVMEKGPFPDIRIRSKKATTSDCSRFLRPGIDICVLSTSPNNNSSDEKRLNPVWADAKISSIQRKPHESECSCQFYVNIYVNQCCQNTEVRTLSKEIKVFGLDQISILQKLENSPCEDQHYRWGSSDDCHSVPQTKLLTGKFLSDISWLVVTSAIKQVSFCVRSVGNKIVYQILEGYSSPLNCVSHLNVLNFRVDNNGMLVSTVSQVVSPDTNKVDQARNSQEDEASPSYNPEGLRRSKRRNVQPERYLGCDETFGLDVGFVRTRPYKFETRKDDDEDKELSLPLSILLGLQENTPVQDGGSGQKFNTTKSYHNTIVYKRRGKPKEVKSGDTGPSEHQSQLAIVPVPDESDPIAVKKHSPNAKVTKPSAIAQGKVEIPIKYYHLMGSTEPKRSNMDLLAFDPYNNTSKIPGLENYAEETDDISSGRHYSYVNPKLQRKNSIGLDDMDFQSRWEGINSNKGEHGKKYHSTLSRSRQAGEEKTYKDRSLSAGAYKELIDSYLKKIDTTPSEAEPLITDQWMQFKETSNYGQKTGIEVSPTENEEETDELDFLWREMEVSLASTYLDEDAEGSNAAVFTETWEKSNKLCRHEFRLNEEIGIYCLKCGFISIEMKDVSPPFMERSIWHQEEKQSCAEGSESEPKADEDEGFHLVLPPALPDEPITEENDNVWALIPELREKLHIHQKKAFEFLWRNIAGSTDPAMMEAATQKRGGCVISHSPGAGKTFLIIAFLVSYLKLFPGKRPLVLAPKTTLYTWYKEFIKWKIPIPVYLIHGRRTYRVFKQNTVVFHGGPKPTDDVKHILDCLEKIQKWHSHPSVLVMGYTSFLTLMREDAKFSHRKYMAKVLRESPGILVLDEGHNPRSTKSRLRKCLMKVQTELRILLSGTLFQNNFCEYFNTLCLARPKFADEVMKKLDPKYRRKKKGTEKARHLIESRARKFFLDNIARKIDSKDDKERKQGLKMLKKITNGFIDVYEGGGSDTLPGLQIYTLLMNTTDIQHEILEKLQKKMTGCNGYPLELELLITLGSIHPWLVKTAVCADKFFSMEQLMELDKFKFDLKKGSKVRFVLSLVYRVVRKEKILIFCHNIAPVKLFVELFELFFGWQRGREVLVLTGELELFERGRVMDKFEEPGGASKILLASISSCAEGISLTAASRVILLDSEWNPSKTKQAVARAFRPGQQKMVYVYQLLVTGTLEEDKYRRTTWKEWVSSMIFSEDFVQDPSKWQIEKIEDDILREMVAEDRSNSFSMIMKNEKASTN